MIYHGNKADRDMLLYLRTSSGDALQHFSEMLDESHPLRTWVEGLLALAYTDAEPTIAVSQCPGCKMAIYDDAALDGWCTNCNPHCAHENIVRSNLHHELTGESVWHCLDCNQPQPGPGCDN